MFTGIVREVGTVDTFDGSRLVVASPETVAGVAVGDSVSVAGVCLTVVETGDGRLAFDVVPETLSRTALAELEPGDSVNLEPALRVGDPLGGHVVQGHVDAVGRIADLRPEADCHWLTVTFPPTVTPYLVHKGSIAVDGISLTVARLGADRFDVQIVPFTMAHTNLSRAQVDDPVNLECDMIGKYVARAIELAGLTLKG